MAAAATLSEQDVTRLALITRHHGIIPTESLILNIWRKWQSMEAQDDAVRLYL